MPLNLADETIFLISLKHTQNVPSNSLQLIRILNRQLFKLSRPRISIDYSKHIITCLLRPGPFHGILYTRRHFIAIDLKCLFAARN